MLQIVIPFLISVHNYWVNIRAKSANDVRLLDKFIAGLYYTLAPILLIAAGFLGSPFGDGWQSTYICPAPRIYLMAMSVILDIAILLAFTEFARAEIRQNIEDEGQTATA